MINQMSHTRCELIEPPIIPLFLAWFLAVVLQISPATIITLYSVFSMFSFVHYCYVVVCRTCTFGYATLWIMCYSFHPHYKCYTYIWYKEGGTSYQLVCHWIEDLKITKHFFFPASWQFNVPCSLLNMMSGISAVKVNISTFQVNDLCDHLNICAFSITSKRR